MTLVFPRVAATLTSVATIALLMPAVLAQPPKGDLKDILSPRGRQAYDAIKKGTEAFKKPNQKDSQQQAKAYMRSLVEDYRAHVTAVNDRPRY